MIQMNTAMKQKVTSTENRLCGFLTLGRRAGREKDREFGIRSCKLATQKLKNKVLFNILK